MNQDEIVQHVGAENWQMVVETFAGKSITDIEDILDAMWPSDDNSALAREIAEQTAVR